MDRIRIERLHGIEAASWRAAELIHRRASQKDGPFSLALSGGRTPRRLYELLSGLPLPWDRVHLFWGDERCVPPGDPRSNFRTAFETLIQPAGIPMHAVHRIPGEAETPDRAAGLYEEQLRAYFGDHPVFDLILLGVGADGHTASLFPGDAALEETGRPVVAVRRDPARVTLTLPVINAARCVVFLVSGEGKGSVIRRILDGDRSLPAGRVRPAGELYWFLDTATLAGLTKR